MKHSAFAHRLRNGEPLIGTLVSLRSTEVVEILANCGFDWLFIDAEHGAFDPHDTQGMLQAAGQCPCVIRVPCSDEVWIKKALDIGAAGIIVPQINTIEQAQAVIHAAKYAPKGKRGVGLARAHGYGPNFENYLANANQDTAIILQAETRQAVENIDAIVALEGVDAILIGPYDLSASLGVIGQVGSDIVKQAIKTVADASFAKGVKMGIFGISPEAVIPYQKQGFSLITVGVDALFLGGTASDTLQQLKSNN